MWIFGVELKNEKGEEWDPRGLTMETSVQHKSLPTREARRVGGKGQNQLSLKSF